MRNHFATLYMLYAVFATGCANRQLAVVELPRPNSGTFTFAQAEARKSDIYSLTLSVMRPEWDNPYIGFSIHITRVDEVVVYDGFWPFYEEGRMSIPQLKGVLSNYMGMLEGNPLGVLITSECDPNSSVALPQVLDLLFEPYVQIFYVQAPNQFSRSNRR